MTAAPVRALVGWSGFVGGSLLPRLRPEVTVRRHDVAQLANEKVDEIVCAGAPAEKWRANADPAADLASIEDLMAALDASSATSCVLVSTVDVYAAPVGVDETREPDRTQDGAYGRHRAQLEDFVASRFDDSLVVRLPGLYGPGLKKNLVYDLLHQPHERHAHAGSTFQFYDVRDLWGHVLLARDAGLRLAHLATEPVSAAEVARQVFDVDYDWTGNPQVAYDLRTAYAQELAGRDGPYLRATAEVLAGMREWVAATRRERSR